MDQFAPITRGVDLRSFSKLMAALAEAMQGGSGGVSNLLGSVETITTGLADRRATLKKLTGDTAGLADVLARRDKQIALMADNLTKLSKGFTDNRVLLGQAADELDGLTTATGRLLTGRAGELERILRDASSVSGWLKDTLPQAQMVLKVLRKVLPSEIWGMIDKGEYLSASVTGCVWWSPPCPYPVPQPGQWEKGIIDFLTNQLKQPKSTSGQTLEMINKILGEQ